MKVAVIGLGYAGLPLCLRLARAGAEVAGIDRDPAKVEALRRKESYIGHIPAEEIAPLVERNRFGAFTETARARGCDAVLICVPTPLDESGDPDMGCVFSTGRDLAPHLARGMTVILESTVYPGATENELRTILEQGSGLEAGCEFHLAYSPEREDPGRSGASSIPKIVGGLTPECRRRAMEVYRPVTERLVPASGCRQAEAAKLLENAYRSVNIALVNEIKMFCDPLGIDIWEVIELARTKPFGFQPFHPGPGVGGHCIPIDPAYLSWKAREHGATARLIDLAGEINHSMPDYVFGRTAQALDHRLEGRRILILGVAYKPDVDDDRGSPAYRLIELFTRAGAAVDYHDPHIPVIRPGRGHEHLSGMRSVPLEKATVASCDAVVVATGHAAVDYRQLGRWARLVVDTRNVMAGHTSRSVVRA